VRLGPAGRDDGLDSLKAGSADIIVAGGMESMTGAPYLMNKHRGGARIGHDVIVDSACDGRAGGRL
jgi:acetyl-CoA acetyltransferase